MIRYLLRRLAWMGFVLFLVATATFFCALRLGNPLATLAGPHATARDREAIVRFYHLDRPAVVQYGYYIAHLVRGDLGKSYRYRRPVAELIAERFPRTLLLGAMALTFEFVFGVALGTLAAVRRGTRLENGLLAATFVGVSTPTFLSGKLLLLGLGYYAGWFPMGGYGDGWLDHLWHGVLPAMVLGLLGTASLARLVRNDMVDTLQADYVRTARAKGLAEATVVIKHALRNALLSVVTSMGLSFGLLFGGAIVTEAIFAWPGLGRLAVDAIYGFDVPVIMGTVLFASAGILVGNLLADLALAALDPRIRDT
jgi:peptide/nickel transport system permease protein